MQASTYASAAIVEAWIRLYLLLMWYFAFASCFLFKSAVIAGKKKKKEKPTFYIEKWKGLSWFWKTILFASHSDGIALLEFKTSLNSKVESSTSMMSNNEK